MWYDNDSTILRLFTIQIIKGVPSIFWGLTWRFLSASLFNISNKPFHKHHSGKLGNLHNNSWPTVITCKYKANIITSKIWKLKTSTLNTKRSIHECRYISSGFNLHEVSYINCLEFCIFSKQTTHFQGHTLSWILASTNVHHVTRYWNFLMLTLF